MIQHPVQALAAARCRIIKSSLFQTLEIFLGSRYDLTGLDLLIALIQLLDDAIIKLLTAFLR